jgi:EmrB/QacA subfamily drug resistance transporter
MTHRLPGAATASPDQEPAVAADGHARWLLVAIAIGTTLAPLNSTMIAVALPEIQRSFNVSVTATAWLVTLYLVAMAVAQPIGGRLGDLYGRRPVYLVGLAWFALASVGCAVSSDLGFLIFFRTQQALAGAMSFPNGAAMVRDAVPHGRRGSAFGTIGLATGLAAASGPPIGGILVHSFGWAATFWANVPVAVVALLLGWRTLPRRSVSPGPRPPFDLAGSGLFAAMLGSAVVIPTLLRFNQFVVAVLVGGAAIALGRVFIARELRITAPVINLRLFQSSHFTAACLSIGLSNMVMYTSLLAIPLYLEHSRGYGVQLSGMVLAALSVLAAFWGPLGGRWTDHQGRWLPAVTGGAAVLVGAILLAVSIHGSSTVSLTVSLAIMGIGIGLSGAPIQTAAVEAVPANSTGSAAGIYSTSRYIGSVIGSSVLAIVFLDQASVETTTRYFALFLGLAIVAAFGVVANSRVAGRHTGSNHELEHSASWCHKK